MTDRMAMTTITDGIARDWGGLFHALSRSMKQAHLSVGSDLFGNA